MPSKGMLPWRSGIAAQKVAKRIWAVMPESDWCEEVVPSPTTHGTGTSADLKKGSMSVYKNNAFLEAVICQIRTNLG